MQLTTSDRISPGLVEGSHLVENMNTVLTLFFPRLGKAYAITVISLLTSVAKYRAQLLEPEKKGPKGEGFDVMKSGGA